MATKNKPQIKDISSYIYIENLKRIKKIVGSKCLHLANRRSVDGGRFVDCTLMIGGVKKNFSFSLPTDLRAIRKPEYDQLEDLIKSKLIPA